MTIRQVLGRFTQAGAAVLAMRLCGRPLFPFAAHDRCTARQREDRDGLWTWARERPLNTTTRGGYSFRRFACLVIANTINAGTDILAIAAAINLFLPIPILAMVVPIAVAIVVLQVWGSYRLIVKVF